MFKIVYLYPEKLNLYGDTGNIHYLRHFLNLHGIDSKVFKIKKGEAVKGDFDFIFAGGGPDSLQTEIYQDFLNKKKFLEKHINSGKPGAFVCGSFQLLGKYYLTSSGEKIKGLDIFDFYTKAPSNQETRLVGNIKVESAYLNKYSSFSDYLIGFENHNGRTFSSMKPLGTTNKKSGNNDKDLKEGFIYKKTIGTYLHGPLFVKNPHLLYFLLENYINDKQKSLNTKSFYSEYAAHHKALNRFF